MVSNTVNSREIAKISGNTVKDGSGTEYRCVVDANGLLQVVQAVLDATTDNVLIVVNTQPDGLGADIVPIADVAGHLQIDVLTMPVVTIAEPISIDDNGGSITVDFTRPVPVTDNAGSLSIDDGGGNISIDDGGNVITIDGNVGIIGAALTALELIDNIVNVETDDDSVPDGEVRQTEIALMHGWYSNAWERIQTDGSGRVLVSYS